MTTALESGAGILSRFDVPLYTVAEATRYLDVPESTPDLHREAGLQWQTLTEVYGIPADEDVPDVAWLEPAGGRGGPGPDDGRANPAPRD